LIIFLIPFDGFFLGAVSSELIFSMAFLMVGRTSLESDFEAVGGGVGGSSSSFSDSPSEIDAP